MRRFVTVFLCLLMCVACGLSFAACGGNTRGDEILIWGGDQWTGEKATKLQQFFDQYTEETGIEVRYEAQQSLIAKLTSAIKINSGPDIVIWDRFFTATNSSILEPLDDMITADALDMSIFHEQAVEELQWNDVTYGIPLDLSAWGIFMNMDIFNAYNEGKSEAEKLSLPEDWDDLKTVANALTIRDGTTVTRAGLNTLGLDGMFYSFALSSGVNIIDEENSCTNVDNTEARRTLEFFKELYDLNVCASGFGDDASFVNGLLAMQFSSFDFPSNIQAYGDVEVKYIGIPKGPDGDVGGMLGGFGVALPKPADNFRNEEYEQRKSRAWDLIKWWIFDADNNLDFGESLYTLSARLDLHDKGIYATDEYMLDYKEQIPYYTMRPRVEGYVQFETNVVRAEIQKMMEGQSVLKTLENIQRDGDAVLG